MGKMLEDRKGQIALAILRLRVAKEGLPQVKPNDVRSEIGNSVKDLNKCDTSLNLTIEEALELYEELFDIVKEAALRPKNLARMGPRRPIKPGKVPEMFYDPLRDDPTIGDSPGDV